MIVYFVTVKHTKMIALCFGVTMNTYKSNRGVLQTADSGSVLNDKSIMQAWKSMPAQNDEVVLVAPNKHIQKQWQKDYPGIKVLLRSEYKGCPPTKRNKGAKNMTNSTEVDEIDTVLRQMFMDAGVKLTDIGWQLSDDVREKAKSALQKMMIEAIGADEKFRIRSSKGRPAVSMGDQIWKSGRNQLRAEIRAKLGIKSKEV